MITKEDMVLKFKKVRFVVPFGKYTTLLNQAEAAILQNCLQTADNTLELILEDYAKEKVGGFDG